MSNKNSIRIGVVALVLAIIFHLQPAQAAEQSGSNKLQPEELKELISYVTKEKVGHKPTSWKKDPGLGGTVWYQSVIITGGEKITLAFFPATENLRQVFTLWWRKNGSTGQDSLFSGGVKPDGTTNGGVDPKKEKVALLDGDYGMRVYGLEYADYWQKETDRRLRAALDYFRKK